MRKSFTIYYLPFLNYHFSIPDCKDMGGYN